MAYLSEPQQTGTEIPNVDSTLLGAIIELTKVSWQIKGLVEGEREPGKPEEATLPADKITLARNMVLDVTKRLREVAQSLEVIGK